jgi:hypothetical protein
MPHNRGNSGNKDKQKQTSEVLNESREALYGSEIWGILNMSEKKIIRNL